MFLSAMHPCLSDLPGDDIYYTLILCTTKDGTDIEHCHIDSPQIVMFDGMVTEVPSCPDIACAVRFALSNFNLQWVSLGFQFTSNNRYC